MVKPPFLFVSRCSAAYSAFAKTGSAADSLFSVLSRVMRKDFRVLPASFYPRGNFERTGSICLPFFLIS